ncbi:MAG TPA: RagB/SusD family nutrient uptake outer membrane protein [Niastella sp.]
MQKSYPVLKTLLPMALLLVSGLQACKKDETPAPATKEVLNEHMTDMVLDMRLALDTYFDVTGIIGRELYRFSPTEPRYTTELLGSGTSIPGNNQFYITAPWQARYKIVKLGAQIIKEAAASTTITDAERRGYTGVAKTFIAHELLMNLNLTWTNGIYINLAADNPASGPVIPYDAALDSIHRMLNDAGLVLKNSVVPPLPRGFKGFYDAAGFYKFNRALAARVAVYRQQWADAENALNESFLSLTGDYNAGPKHAFATYQGDIFNPFFINQNQTGNVRLAHPSYAAGTISIDARLVKAIVRNNPVTQDGLTSNRDITIYVFNASSIPIIRNEELILLYAEIKAQQNQLPDALTVLNRIRYYNNLSPYAGAVTQAELITEILHQRRYSLAFEGHYWVDMRRYSRLNQLPIDRAGDDVWEKLPLPAAN